MADDEPTREFPLTRLHAGAINTVGQWGVKVGAPLAESDDGVCWVDTEKEAWTLLDEIGGQVVRHPRIWWSGPWEPAPPRKEI
jgi:hypothetical protein